MSPALSGREFIARAERTLGSEYVKPVDDDARRTLDAVFGPGVPPSARPRVLARPRDVAQLQELVRIAAGCGHSIWSVMAAGGNGASIGAADKPGVLVDLSRMDRIISLDAASATVLLEPGVTYAQLAAHLEQHQLPFWLDSEANGGHSVLGSMIDRSWGYTPYGDHLLMQCGFEICDAGGRLLRTGMGALPGNNTWQLFKYNFGPYLDGLYSRGGPGLITKAGLWLMPAPPAWQPFAVTLPDDAALAAAIELLRPFKHDMSLPGTVVISHVDADAALIDAAKPAQRPDFIALLQDGRVNTWNLYAALYGLPGNVELIWDALQPALAALPGAKLFSDADSREDALWQARRGLLQGRPAYQRDAVATAPCLWFVASAALDGADARRLVQLTAGPLRDYDIAAQGEFALGWRTLFYRVTVPYSAADFHTKQAIVLDVTRRLSAAGFAISHDCPALTAAIGRQQTGEGLKRLYAQLGQALDPAGLFGFRMD